MAEKVYVLTLDTGKYSDRCEVIVGVFSTEDKARAVADARIEADIAHEKYWATLDNPDADVSEMDSIWSEWREYAHGMPYRIKDTYDSDEYNVTGMIVDEVNG